MSKVSPTIFISQNANDIPSDDVMNDPEHHVRFGIDESCDAAQINFSSRLAMYDFARQLLHESIYGSGESEFVHLSDDNAWYVSNGVRLTQESARVFISYPTK